MSFFWPILIPPLYGYIFNRKAYHAKFQKSLKADKMNNHSCAKIDQITKMKGIGEVDQISKTKRIEDTAPIIIN